MIYVDLSGRLGNQMFQYACARALQEKYGYKICLNSYNLKKNSNFKVDLLNYKLNENVIFEEEKPLPWYTNNNCMVMKITRKIFPETLYSFLSRYGVFLWMSSEYKEITNSNKADIYLSGWWQSEEYFKEIRNVILEEFTPKYNLLDKNRDFYNLIKSTNSVCITIRRGNYVDNENLKKKFYLCDEEYFIRAVKKIRKEIPDSYIFVFSDDVEWVKNNIEFGENVFYENGNDPVWEKLRLMSACKNFIISNSSFSWWAQYLSTNNNRIVYAPSRWYTNNRKVDIYQQNWRLISV